MGCLRRGIAIAAVLAAGCGFQPMATGTGDAPGDDGGPRDAPRDATTEACGGKVWIADFAGDPTLQDLNGDSVADWALRDGSAFPTTQLSGGVWHIPSAAFQPLDTQPKQLFDTRTIIHGRMKGAASNGAKGAVVYINVGFQPGVAADSFTFAPCFVDAKLESGGTQTLNLWGKDAGGSDMNLATVTGLPNAFIDFELDLDPTTLQATLTGGGESGTYQLVRQAETTSTPEWVSLVGYSTAADFDRVSIEVCP